MCQDPLFFARQATLVARRVTSEDKSAYQIIQETGVLEHLNEITVELLTSTVEKEPSLIGDWLTWSENKRTSGGWYFVLKNGDPVVGSIEGERREVFSDISAACANYVKNEIEVIAGRKVHKF